MGEDIGKMSQSEIDDLFKGGGGALDLLAQDDDDVEAPPPSPTKSKMPKGDVLVNESHLDSKAKKGHEEVTPPTPKIWPGAKTVKISEILEMPAEKPEEHLAESKKEHPSKGAASKLTKPAATKDSAPPQKAEVPKKTKPPVLEQEPKIRADRHEHDLDDLDYLEEGLKKRLTLGDLDDAAKEPKRGLIAGVVDRLRGLMKRGGSDDTAADAEMERQVSDVSQRLHKIESVCDRLNEPPEEVANAAEALRRIEKIEGTLETIAGLADGDPKASLQYTNTRLERVERSIESLPSLIDDVRRMREQVLWLVSRVDTISAGLQDTPSYALHKNYLCKSCGSEGQVAIVVRCTKCGKQRWQGWWPEEPPAKTPPPPTH